MTASLGDLVSEFMKRYNVLNDNVHVIGNGFKYDSEGKAVSVKKIIHVFNKHEMEISDPDILYDLVKRKNVLLLGDSLGDVKMIEGFNYDNLIKIGFLKINAEENLDRYKEDYDVIVLNDGDFRFVNELLDEIIRKV